MLQPDFRCRCIKRPTGTFLVCRGELQPTALSHTYRVRVEYQCGRRPQVWIESPALLRRKPDERIPHTFADDRPCLFKHDFRSDQVLARTIIPWLAMWLFFYEAWRVTGEWAGGGAHAHENDDQNMMEVA